MRDAFSCRPCEIMVQAPAPHYAIARCRAGPGLPAHIALAFDEYLPRSRQVETNASEGIASQTPPLFG
ncbi:MAG: hypothetical protein MIL41_09795 [Hyphomicrobiales bacterium]